MTEKPDAQTDEAVRHDGQLDDVQMQARLSDPLHWQPTSPQPTNVARVIAQEMLQRATVALMTLAKVWSVDRQIDPTRDSSLIVQFAHLTFSSDHNPYETIIDDANDLRGALDKVMQGVLRATDKQHGCSSQEKRTILEDIIGRLELILGVAYSPTADLATVQAIDLNRAGASFAWTVDRKTFLKTCAR